MVLRDKFEIAVLIAHGFSGNVDVKGRTVFFVTHCLAHGDAAVDGYLSDLLTGIGALPIAGEWRCTSFSTSSMLSRFFSAMVCAGCFSRSMSAWVISLFVQTIKIGRASC